MSKCQPPWVAPLFNLDRDMRTRVLTNPSNNRNPALGVLWSWHRVASPSIEIPIRICSLSGNFDLWSHPPIDHKETKLTHLVTETCFLLIPIFFVSFEDACVKKIILFKWGLNSESNGLPSWLLNLVVTWPVFFFWENYPYVRETSFHWTRPQWREWEPANVISRIPWS